MELINRKDISLKSIKIEPTQNQSYSTDFFIFEYYCGNANNNIALSPQQINFKFTLPVNELKHKIVSSSTVKWIERPTGNCQVSTIGYFNTIIALANNIIYYYDRDQEVIKKEDIIACYIKYMYNIIFTVKGYQFRLLWLDVSSDNSLILDSFIKKYALSTKFKNPYISSNGSNMVSYLIDFRQFDIMSIPDVFKELFIPKPKPEPKSINGSRIVDLQLTHVRKDTYICDTCKESISPDKVYKALKDNKYVYFHTKCINKNESTTNDNLPF